MLLTNYLTYKKRCNNMNDDDNNNNNIDSHIDIFLNTPFDENSTSLYLQRIILKSQFEKDYKNNNNRYLLVIYKLLKCFNIYDRFSLLNKEKIINYLDQILDTAKEKKNNLLNLDILHLLELGIYIEKENDEKIIEKINEYTNKVNQLYKQLENLQPIHHIKQEEKTLAIQSHSKKGRKRGTLEEEETNEELKAGENLETTKNLHPMHHIKQEEKTHEIQSYSKKRRKGGTLEEEETNEELKEEGENLEMIKNLQSMKQEEKTQEVYGKKRRKESTLEEEETNEEVKEDGENLETTKYLQPMQKKIKN